MRVSTRNIDGIDILMADFGDIATPSLTDAQLSDIETIRAEKRRRERAMTYALINHAATDRRYASLHGSLVGHRPDGAPFLLPAVGESPVSISISHCRSGACIALGTPDRQFGIDIEDATDRFQRVADKFLNDNEKAFITTDLLLRAWTIKEAAYKAAGIDGLTLRDGIAIQSIDYSSCLSRVRVRDTVFTAISLPDTARCITLCVRHS